DPGDQGHGQRPMCVADIKRVLTFLPFDSKTRNPASVALGSSASGGCANTDQSAGESSATTPPGRSGCRSAILQSRAQRQGRIVKLTRYLSPSELSNAAAASIAVGLECAGGSIAVCGACTPGRSRS